MVRRLLLVEDDRLSRESLEYLLRREGFEVTGAESAEEAVPRAADCSHPVALIDIRLPGMRGDELAGWLLARCPETRLAFISGEYVIDAEGRFGPRARFFSKPLDFDELMNFLDQ